MIDHEEEQAKFLKLLEEKFLSYFALEGWEYIVDNMVHDVYSPEDFGEDEESTSWMYELALTEIEAQKALASYFSKVMEDITGHTWTMVDEGRVTMIEDI